MTNLTEPTLVLAITPDAIREHFDGESSRAAQWVATADDEALRKVGFEAVEMLENGDLWDLFHRAVSDAANAARLA